MDQETHLSPANTQEFMALWNTAKEEHFVSQLQALVPHLFSGSVGVEPERAEWAARHLFRALHLAAMPDAGVHAAIAYLTEIVEGRKDLTAP